jgi:hypothetical protein
MKKIIFINLIIFLFINLGNTMSLEKGKSIKIKLEEGQSTTIGNVKITVNNFVEAFVQYEGRHSSFSTFKLIVEKGEKKLSFDAKYGEVLKAFGYSIKVDWCVTGTRDFKSHAVLLITKTVN